MTKTSHTNSPPELAQSSSFYSKIHHFKYKSSHFDAEFILFNTNSHKLELLPVGVDASGALDVPAPENRYVRT